MSPTVRTRLAIAVTARTILSAALIVAPAGAWRAQGQAPRTPAPRAQPDTRLGEASRALSAGDLARALAVATAYLKAHPSDRQARALLLQVQLGRDDLDAAYSLASALARENPRDVDALYYLGLVTRRMAAAELSRLMQGAPDSARAHQLQAEILETRELRAEAEKEYATALAKRPDLLEALLGLGKLKRIRLACDEAVALYEKAESIRPTFDGAFGLGICYAILQDDERAVARFEAALKKDPNSAVAWAGLGTSLVKLRRNTDGVAALQKAIQIEPAMAEAHFMLGRAYQDAGDTARAEAAFKKADQLRMAR